MKRTPQVVGIIGGGGFLGRYVVRDLARQGYLVKVGSHQPEKHLDLKTSATIGKIQLVFCDVRSKGSVDQFVDGCDVVMNLAGILFEGKNKRFETIHAQGAAFIATAAKEKGVKQLIHVSALGIEGNRSIYAKTKLSAEESVRKIFHEAVIVRPSLIFGAEDKFFNKFAAMALISPILPVFKGGHTEFQPVYVGDVSEALVFVVKNQVKSKIFELAGPEKYTFRDLLDMMMDVIGKARRIVPFPTIFGGLISFFSKFIPEPLLTLDQLRLLEANSVFSGKYPGLKDLSITPHTLGEILPTYLKRFV